MRPKPLFPLIDSREALPAEVRDADSLLMGLKQRADRDFLESAGRLRHIARFGVGVDSVDLKTATERGILVTNAPEVTAGSVSEFTMALLLALAKNIPRCDTAVKTGQWDERLQLIYANMELNGKTHGIVGLGAIGSRVAVRCKAFGMKATIREPGI